MADIITAIKDDPGFCVTVLAAFLAFIGILCAADLKTSKGIKLAVSAGIVCAAVIGVAIIYFSCRCVRTMSGGNIFFTAGPGHIGAAQNTFAAASCTNFCCT